MSRYLQSLTDYLHDGELLTDDLKSVLIEHDNAFNSKPSVKINFGKYKGKTVAEVSQFDKKYLDWLVRQNWCFDDIKEEIQKKYLK